MTMTAAARPKPTTMKLEAGTPITGIVKFVDFYPEKENPKEPGKTFSAQWAFTGDFSTVDSVAYGKVYIDTYQMEENPVKAGLVAENGKWDDGNPKFKWTGRGPVTFSKYLKDKKAHVRITPAGAVGAVQPAQVGNGAPAERSTVAAASPALTPISQWWAEQEHLMSHCQQIATRIHGTVATDGMHQAMVAIGNSLFIQANREGKLPPPSAEQQAETIRANLDSYAAMPKALEDGPPDPEVPAWMQ
jgi:hypothetical protein